MNNSLYTFYEKKSIENIVILKTIFCTCKYPSEAAHIEYIVKWLDDFFFFENNILFGCETCKLDTLLIIVYMHIYISYIYEARARALLYLEIFNRAKPVAGELLNAKLDIV